MVAADIGQSAESISETLNLIFSTYTRMSRLSLHASIEAECWSEQKGPADVAPEVRELVAETCLWAALLAVCILILYWLNTRRSYCCSDDRYVRALIGADDSEYKFEKQKQQAGKKQFRSKNLERDGASPVSTSAATACYQGPDLQNAVSSSLNPLPEEQMASELSFGPSERKTSISQNPVSANNR